VVRDREATVYKERGGYYSRDEQDAKEEAGEVDGLRWNY
jgi:hypothetical protein